MKQRFGKNSVLSIELYDPLTCSFGISEGLGAVLGGDVLAGIFGGGEAVAATAAPTAAATDLSGIVGTGTGLFGGQTGLEGTLLSGGATGGVAEAAGTGVAGGALGTANSFLSAPTASALNPDLGGGVLGANDVGAGSSIGINNNPFGTPPSSVTPGVMTTGAPTGEAPIALNATGPNGPAAPTSAVAPTGAGPTDLTGTGTYNGAGTPVQGATGNTSFGGEAGPQPLSTPTGAAPPGTNSGNFFSNLGDKALGQITNNPLSLAGPAAGIAGLAYTLTQANKQLPEQAALTSAATTATNTGNTLSNYLLTGTLPPGLQTTLDKATADAKTAAISNAARNGQSTDPTQNTSLGQQLASIDQQATITKANIGQQLLTSGLSETQLGSQDYSTLLAADQTEQNLISQSIGNFAKSLGGLGTSGLRLNIGGSGTSVTS